MAADPSLGPVPLQNALRRLMKRFAGRSAQPTRGKKLRGGAHAVSFSNHSFVAGSVATFFPTNVMSRRSANL